MPHALVGQGRSPVSPWVFQRWGIEDASVGDLALTSLCDPCIQN